MRAPEPAELAAAVERGQPVPEGSGERFAGYAVLGVSFCSGDVLALRRFPVVSAGCAYTSVWHCDPDGQWTFYTDVAADQGCARYFATALNRVVVAPIRVEWNGPRSLSVAVDGGRLITWSLELSPTVLTSAFNRVAPKLSAVWPRHPRLLSVVEMTARLALRAGALRLTGRTPSGARFLGSPQALWLVARSRATIGGVDVGRCIRLQRQLALGDFTIPRRGLFATSHAFMTTEPHP
jgi:hypothetical protein